MIAIAIFIVTTFFAAIGFVDMRDGGKHAIHGWFFVIMGAFIILIYIGYQLERIADRRAS